MAEQQGNREQTLPVMAPDLGLITGAPAHLLPERAWARVNNGRFRRGRAEKVPGFVLSQDDALDGDIVGLFDFQRTDGFDAWIAVTTTRIYKREPTDPAFVDITDDLLTGGPTDWADFAIFRDVLIITNGVDAPLKWDGDTATVELLGGSPPIARRVATFQNHLVFANIEPYGTAFPQTVRWSDLGLFETWTGGEAGALTFTDEPSAVVEIMPLRDILMVYKENAGYVMEYTGFPFTMSTRRLFTGMGPIASRAVVDVRDAHFFPSTDTNVYKVTLAGPEPVGQASRIGIFSEITTQFQNTTFGFLNDPDNEVIWAIPTGGAQTPNIAHILEYLEDKWGRRELVATAASPSGVKQLIDFTWDGLPGTWDQQTLTWDDTRHIAGANIILHGDADGFVYQHSAGELNANGVAIDGDLWTRVFDFGDPVRYKRLLRLHLMYTVRPGEVLEVSVYTSQTPDGTQSLHGPFEFTMDSQDEPWIDMNISGRFFQFRFRNQNLSQTFALSGFAPVWYLREVG